MIEWQDLFSQFIQLCCSVFDSIGGAESYSVSVSCVGSPASVQGLDNVPAPQSQKNLEERKPLNKSLLENGTKIPSKAVGQSTCHV